MALTKREQRAINAFTNCVRSGEYTEDYAVTLLEDDSRFGWMSEAGREVLRGFLHYAGATPEADHGGE